MRFHRPAPGTRTLLGAVGLLALSTTGLYFLSVPFGSREDRVSEAPAPLPRPSPSLAGPLRSRPWSLESLPGLSFDEALTLLGTEVESIGKAPAAARIANLTRIEQVSARLGEMHVENVRKIAKAASYYESHSAETRERFARFRATYEDRWQTLQGSLEDLRAGDAGAGDEIQGLLEESGALRPPVPIPAAEDLPRRRLPARGREPRLTGEEWQAPKKVGVAPRDGNDRDEELGFVDRLLGVRAAHAQAAGDDLAETPEVRFSAGSTPEIQKLLDDEGLRGSPARIASWVRSHIEFVPIWGALQSSVTCLENRKGTAMDIASLTIALLRASGIRARYQAGTVRLPIEEAKNWLGNFESAIAASSLLQSGGIPAVVQVDGSGQPVALRFEHVWVRAFVDYVPHQGTCHVEGDTWVDLDACVKTLDHRRLVDLEDFIPWESPEGFLDEIFSTANVNPDTGEISGLDLKAISETLSWTDSSLEEFLKLQGSLTRGQLLGLGRIVGSNAVILGAAPPFEILAGGWERPELDASDRFEIEVTAEASGGEVLRIRMLASEVGGSRFSLSFRPETDVDARIIGDQFPVKIEDEHSKSLYVAGVRLVPEILRNGKVFAKGSVVDMGEPMELVVEYREPILVTPPIRMRILAGEMAALALDLVGVPPALMRDIQVESSKSLSQLASHDLSFDTAALQEVMLSAAIHLWFSEADVSNTLIGSVMGCLTHRYPSAGLCSSKWTSETIFGLPLSGRERGLTMDVPGDVVITLSRDGDVRRMRDVTILQGLIGSGLEGQVPMLLYNTPEAPASWIGTTGALALANQLGDTLVVVSQENSHQVLPRLGLGSAERDEIREAIDRGLSVFAHESRIAELESCHAGYVIFDPVTGNGTYRMSGGTCGGSSFTCVFAKDPMMLQQFAPAYGEYNSEFYEKVKKHMDDNPFNSATIEQLDSVIDDFIKKSIDKYSLDDPTCVQGTEGQSCFDSRAMARFLLQLSVLDALAKYIGEDNQKWSLSMGWAWNTVLEDLQEDVVQLNDSIRGKNLFFEESCVEIRLSVALGF